MTDTSLQTRFGIANPESADNAVWRASITQHLSAWRLRKQAGAIHLGQSQPGRSDYRDTTPGPFWSWQRFGRTSTALLDGRIVHVAGEHEDWYDSDFCIYNDVVVEHPGGEIEIFLYPKDVFPPTDFHTATPIGRDIILIGSLGYSDLRRFGATQVSRLDTESFRIEPIATTGDNPGWIAHHAAARVAETEIQVAGGKVVTAQGSIPNTDAFTLDLTTMVWKRDVVRTATVPADERHVLEAIEIECAVADLPYPLPMDSLKLIDFFARNAAGNWACVRPIAIAGGGGEPLLIRPSQTFSREMNFAGVDFHEHLQRLARRADRP